MSVQKDKMEDKELNQNDILKMIMEQLKTQSEQQTVLTRLIASRFGNPEELSAEEILARDEAVQARKDTELQSRLNPRIKTFVFDLENEKTFSEWYERYEDFLNLKYFWKL